jgi:hypothetical protein
MRVGARSGVRALAAACGLALLAAGCAAGPAPTLTYASGATVSDLSGVWEVTSYTPRIRTLDGSMPPLRPEAEAVYQQNIVARAEMPPREDMTRCVPTGVPRINYAPFPLLILQTERKFTFVYEYQHILRHIYMDEALPDADAAGFSYLGDSVGRWDGDTLVVETNGFNDQTVLDREGMPHSPSMTVTERLRPIDGGRRLENVITIDDPETFTAPWSTRLVFERKPGATVEEYNCWLEYEDY